MRKILRKGRKINKKVETAIEEVERDMAMEGRMAMIQALIPLGLKAVEFELQEELLRASRCALLTWWHGEAMGS